MALNACYWAPVTGRSLLLGRENSLSIGKCFQPAPGWQCLWPVVVGGWGGVGMGWQGLACCLPGSLALTGHSCISLNIDCSLTHTGWHCCHSPSATVAPRLFPAALSPSPPSPSSGSLWVSVISLLLLLSAPSFNLLLVRGYSLRKNPTENRDDCYYSTSASIHQEN